MTSFLSVTYKKSPSDSEKTIKIQVASIHVYSESDIPSNEVILKNLKL